MLSLSADITESDVNLKMINGDETATDGGVEHAAALMKFAEAVACRDEDVLAIARAALLAASGAELLVDAAAVAANFQRMVRIADSTGIPLDERRVVLAGNTIKDLDLERFDSARNTPPVVVKEN